MKNKICLILVAAFSIMLISGCSVDTMSGEKQQNLTPYTLCGSNDDWEINCEVRELTTEEKQEKLKELENDWEAEEELLLSEEKGKEQYELIKQQHEQLKQELTEEKAYVSIITGSCNNGELEGQTFDYQLTGEKNEKIISGTQTVSSGEAGEWYRSWQTESDTQNGLFIPPEKNTKMVITLGEEEIVIPLELTTNLTDKS